MNPEIRLNPPSRWAVSVYSGDKKKTPGMSYSQTDDSAYKSKYQTQQVVPYNSTGKNKYLATPHGLVSYGPSTSDIELALTGINSTEQISINFNKVLNTRKGDLAMIQREVFRCRPKIEYLENIPLILKRVECIDRRVYDLKVHECDLFMKYRRNPCFISLFSYWSEPTTNKYAYRNLIQLFEEASYGDMVGTIMMNSVLPSTRILLKYLCDISKALSIIHASNIIHGAVRPSNIYICAGNQAKLGEFKKVELDAMRQTNQLSSKLLIGQAIPKTLIYWAPELLSTDKYDIAIDMWALGITFYQIITAEQPFNVTNEEQFRSDVLSGKVTWAPLKEHPKILKVVQNLLQVNPKNRWTANHVLSYCQDFFAAEIQNAWKGYYHRREFKRISTAMVKIQAGIKGFLTRIHYQRDRILAREKAALSIQKKFRSFEVSKTFRNARRLVMRIQANVLTRQVRRAFLKMKIDTIMGQAFIRRYLAMSWYHQLKKQKYELENNLENINKMIHKYNSEAQTFQGQFSTKRIGGPLKQVTMIEPASKSQSKFMSKYLEESPSRSNYGLDSPPYNRQNEEEEKEPQRRFAQNQRSNESLLYEREQLSKNPSRSLKSDSSKKLMDLISRSRPLELQMQHNYSYNKWDSLYEPFNVIENVLKDNEFTFKGLNPTFDFNLHHGSLCFLAEIKIVSAEPGPGDIEIYISQSSDKWEFLKVHSCNKNSEQRIPFKEEVYAKHLRLKCLDNIRGGNLCCVRFIQVYGVPTQSIGSY